MKGSGVATCATLAEVTGAEEELSNGMDAITDAQADAGPGARRPGLGSHGWVKKRGSIITTSRE
eukprot:1157834-Pelagomonas_calceolata.AAC.13